MQGKIYTVICPSCGTKYTGQVGYVSPHQGYYYCQNCTATVNINPATGEVIPYDVWANYNYNYKKEHYPGLYGHEKQEAKFSPELLFKVLYKPKEAFVELYNITDMKIGILLIVLFGALSTLITFLAYRASGLNSMPMGIGSELPISWVYFLASLPLAIISSLIISWLSAMLSGGRKDTRKTIALIGYAGMPAFIMGLVSSLIIAGNFVTMPDYSDPMNIDFNAILVYSATMGVIVIINFIWSLIVSGYAVSVANDVSFGSGVLSYFVASIILGIVSAIIMIPIVIAMI